MTSINTTVFSHAPAGYITVEAKKSGESSFSTTTILISDILRVKEISNNPEFSTILSRSQNDVGNSHELIIKATHSHIMNNIEAHRQKTDILPDK